ncbi:MAG: DNA-binding protein [Limisphaerales bacterium]
MITTRPHSETIIARIRRDREFARLFYAGAVEMLLEGDAAGALSRLRDLVNAQITFKELSRQTGLGEKSLHRMLNHNGNPTARNLGAIVRSIAEGLDIKPRVDVVEGQQVKIVKRGKAIALLSPPPAAKSKKIKLPDFEARRKRIFGDRVLPGNIIAEERESYE